MLNYNEVTKGKFITLDGAPYEVLSSNIFRKQQRKPVNQVRLKNLVTGKIAEKSLQQSDRLEEAEIETQNIVYMYNNKGEFWFRDADDKSKRFKLGDELVGNQMKFIKENSEIAALVFNDEVMSIKIPVKAELKVTEAPNAVRGNTAQGANKQVTLETGATIHVPIFVNEGDTIRVNTETGEYAERVS
ncbi:MAG: elongation factor P [Patescibacteria group bacterium]